MGEICISSANEEEIKIVAKQESDTVLLGLTSSQSKPEEGAASEDRKKRDVLSFRMKRGPEIRRRILNDGDHDQSLWALIIRE